MIYASEVDKDLTCDLFILIAQQRKNLIITQERLAKCELRNVFLHNSYIGKSICCDTIISTCIAP